MGDPKTPFTKPIFGDVGTLSGAGVISSGSDANADGNDGAAGLVDIWPDAKQPFHENSLQRAESANSVSGLPALPNRFEPAVETVDIPDLTDRTPGTIDKR